MSEINEDATDHNNIITQIHDFNYLALHLKWYNKINHRSFNEPGQTIKLI